MIFKRLLQTSSKQIAFAFDIDGVLLRSKTPIPGAAEALRLLHDNKVPFILLTNGGGQLEKDRVEFISDALNVPISPLQIVLSHTPYKGLVNRYDRILAVGTPSVRKVAEDYGFKDVVHPNDILRYRKDIAPFSGLSDQQIAADSREISELDSKRFDAVLVFNDPHNWGADIQIISDAINSVDGMLNTYRNQNSSKPSIPIYFSNQDLLWANSYTLNRFGQGAFRILIRQLYTELNGGQALEDHAIGKPTTLTYDFAHHVLIDWLHKINTKDTSSTIQKLPALGLPPKQTPFSDVYMIGDNPASDIIGAQLYGWKSCLVRTGVYRDGAPLKHIKPTMIVDDVYQAVTSVLDQQ